MKKSLRILLLAVAMCCAVSANAQEKNGGIVADLQFGANGHSIAGGLMASYLVEVNHLFSSGAGLGFVYDDGSTLPIYAEARYRFGEKRVAAFIDLKCGLAININHSADFYPMLYASPTIGVDFGKLAVGVTVSAFDELYKNAMFGLSFGWKF